MTEHRCKECGSPMPIEKEEIQQIINEELEAVGELMRVHVVDRPDYVRTVQAQVTLEMIDKHGEDDTRVATAWHETPKGAVRKAVMHMLRSGGDKITHRFQAENVVT